MADVLIKYSCGCGFKTENMEEAIEHCDNRGHSLTVLGTIRNQTNPKK